ncbi:MAG: hypothetical protein A3J76_00870 [Candidatus Moranbacteria bacterium RBG_13_45_13]|nr:MAG: hypothetical protein A3J76_00870 [Candidatus Moranbacteria bacterium RBG_13_45_13]
MIIFYFNNLEKNLFIIGCITKNTKKKDESLFPLTRKWLVFVLFVYSEFFTLKRLILNNIIAEIVLKVKKEEACSHYIIL